MDQQRKTLSEFTKIYLRSLGRQPIGTETLDEDEDHFPACVALGMKRAKLVLEPRER